jgi:hypothetical protein
MSDLQLGLAITGGLVLAVFVAHGAWTTRKNTPKQASTQMPDLQQQDPDFGPDTVPMEMASDAPAFHLPVAAQRLMLDALIDVIAPMTLESPVPGDAAWAAMPSTRRVGTKPFAIEGFNQASQTWESLHPGQRYTSFQAGVQLANRSGALNEIEFSEFVIKTQSFADAVGANPEFPDMLEEVARARELDQFASAHDAQLGFTIRARHASWSPGYIHQNVSRLGFVAGAMAGRMVLAAREEGLPPVLVLSFDAQAVLAEDPAHSAIRSMVMHLDAAQVDPAEKPFERMCTSVLAIAEAMDGVITDDNGQVLVPDNMHLIGGELQNLYAILEKHDLAAGSALARRLFSRNNKF